MGDAVVGVAADGAGRGGPPPLDDQPSPTLLALDGGAVGISCHQHITRNTMLMRYSCYGVTMIWPRRGIAIATSLVRPEEKACDAPVVQYRRL